MSESTSGLPGLSALFSARSFVLIGASDKSGFSRLVHANLVAGGHEHRTYLVNRRSSEVHGRRAYPSCAAIDEQVDLAFVMVPAEHVAAAVDEAADIGVRSVVVLSSGFAENGDAGRARQAELLAVAQERGVVVLGPNCLGFAAVAAGLPALALSDLPTRPGGVALISQSGASSAAMKDFAELAGVGLSHVITVGNEAMVTVGHLVEHLTSDDDVHAFALFVEGIREPAVFRRAVQEAARRGKAVVVLKAGRSELAAKAATAHTGALVGDDRTIDAVFRQDGVIRVDTIEQMLVTAGIAAHTGPLRAPGIGVVSISGGACDVVADLAETEGMELPVLTTATEKVVRARMPDFGHVQNPLDVTGAAIIDPELFTTAVAAVGSDPAIGAVLVVNSLPWREAEGPFYGQPLVDAIGAGMASSAAPGLYVTQTVQPLGPRTAEVLAAGRVPHAVPGMSLAVQAMARIARWSRTRAALPPRPADLTNDRVAGLHPRAPMSEADARRLLEGAGIPAVPAVHVHDAEAALAAARRFAEPLAMKVVSADIAHKSDIGGVQLAVAPEDAGTAYEELMKAGRVATAGAEPDGVLVSPMRSGGVELLVGVTRDPDWGLLLAVGLGGVLVEVLDDIGVVPLPATPVEVRAALEDLRGAALLRGVRGRPATDLERLVEVIVAVAELAGSLGPELEALEVNPVRVDGSVIEALDALVTWTT